MLKRICKHFLEFWLFLFVLVLALINGFTLYYLHHVNQQSSLEMAIDPEGLCRYVNPFIGTGGTSWMCAYNFPGPSLPYGMVRLGPETSSMILNRRALNTSGYFYGDNKILSFSHTRLNGTGAVDGGHFLVTPVAGSITQRERLSGKRYKYSHANEKAFPGYYAVLLPEPGVLAELTATLRVGIHRYTFSSDKKPTLLINVSNHLGRGRASQSRVRIFPTKNEIEGQVTTFGSFSGRYGGITVYFVARLDQQFHTSGIWDQNTYYPDEKEISADSVGVQLGFASSTQAIELRLAISYVSIENARENLEAETAGLSFEDIVRQAQESWNEKLSLIEIDGAGEEQKTIFYTALYRCFQMPTLFNDVDGEYVGFDKQVHRAEGFRYFTDISLWDTFRTTHPLYALVAPQDQRDMVVSLTKMAEQGGGWLPRWPSGEGYTNSMLGTPADIVVAESWLKGIRDFDVDKAYEAMKRTALEPTPRGAPFSGREGIADYLLYRYCPADKMKEAVSRTLEFCWADYAVANLARALGREDEARLFEDHSQYYKNTWNPETRFFQPRNSDGTFAPIKPKLLSYMESSAKYTNDYVEGNAWQWRWGAFFDPEGMISLFRSTDYFVSQLNKFFEKANNHVGYWYPGHYYWHGNQPDIHAAYLFNPAGRPDLTQKWVRWIMETKYKNSYYGIDGNDDGGTLSAWYLFSALGFYPVAGTDIYQLGSPLFKKALVHLPGGDLTIVAENNSLENIYVKKVWLNGQLLDRWHIRHREIAKGGTLRFEMANF